MKGCIAVVVALHLSFLGFAAGLFNWIYLLVAGLCGALIWGAYSTLVPPRRLVGLFAGIITALAVQPVASRFWRSQFGRWGPPLTQFTTVHVVIGFGLARLRRQAPPHFFEDYHQGDKH